VTNSGCGTRREPHWPTTARSRSRCAGRSEHPEPCSAFGATSLHYLTLDGLQASTGLPREQFCRACFDGDYPIEVPEEYAMCKMRFEKDAATLCDP